MQVSEAIRKRRSVRKYKDTSLGYEQIGKILESGMWAPSGLNNQPWRFKVLQDKEIIAGLSKFTECKAVIKNAPALICVFLDNAASYNREKDIMAIGACIQNILLAAYELKIATCWLGEILNKKHQVKDYLGVTADCELMAVITLGLPKETPKSSRKRLKTFFLT